jgi:hypothetical protein
VCKGYRYASTQPITIDPTTGKKKLTRILWGNVSETLVLTPNKTFMLADTATRASLVFPSDWDISAVKDLPTSNSPGSELTAAPHRGRPSYEDEEVNRLYGDIWLLENICETTGMKKDLLSVFEGDAEKVADLLTLAFFPYVTAFSYNRVERWQRICKAPSTTVLSPDAITHFMQSLTEANRMDMFRMRKKRLHDNEFLAVDSTSRSSYGESLSAVRWGKNKEGDRLPQVNDLVVYGLTSHMPVYYRQLPGNTPDTRTVDILVTELEHAGFGDTPLFLDRGYSSAGSLELLVRKGKPFVMCSKVGWSLVSTAIDALHLSADGTRPACFTVDSEYRLYHYQEDLPYTIDLNGGGTRAITTMKLNLYYDPERRGSDIMQVDIDIISQGHELEKIRQKGLEVRMKELRTCFPYYSVTLDEGGKHVTTFVRNEESIKKALRLSGFIAIISNKVDGDSKTIWDWYHLRDEQEKLFSQLKTQMAGRRCRAWSEEGHEGRLLVMFVALTCSSYVRHVWKSTSLKEKFTTSLEILDEMRSIRCVEHTHRAKKITPFIGKQVDICEAFGFEIPKGCSPVSKLKKKPKKTIK